MSDFYSRKPVAAWRIVFYGIFASILVAMLGYFENDNRLYIEAIILGLLVGGFGFALSYIRASSNFIQVKHGQSQGFPRWLYWVFGLALLVSSAVKVWFMLQKS